MYKVFGKLNSKFAPSGYGLGETLGGSLSSDTIDSAVNNGWYYYYDRAWENLIPYFESPIGTIRVDGNTRRKTQTFYAAHGGYIAQRTWTAIDSGAWDEWECVNPPMELGVEYRTTERWLGKPVYTKIVDCGTLPASGHKSVEVLASDASECISFEVFAKDATDAIIKMPHANTSGTIIFWGEIANSRKQIILRTNTDLSAFTGYSIIKYTKG